MAEILAQDNKTQAIADVLAGKAPPVAETLPEPTPSNGNGDAAPIETAAPVESPELTPTSLAEKLGIKPSELFDTLKIPVDGGDALTLSEFKDAGKELRTVRQAQHELAEKQVAFENGVMLQRQQLQAAIGKIPPDLLTPEMIADVQSEHQTAVDTERAALFKVRPELSDPGKWSTMRGLLVEHLKPYGFHAIEVDGIIDHRLAKYVIDNAERAIRIKALEAEGLVPAKPEKLAGTGRQPQKPAKAAAQKATVQRGRRATTALDKAAEVAKLLG